MQRVTHPTGSQAGYSSTGNTSSGSNIISGVASTVGIHPGCYLDYSSGFADLGRLLITAVTVSTITVNRNANATLTGITIIEAPEMNLNGIDGIKARTVVDAKYLNSLQEEIANLIEARGITLDATNMKQLVQAILPGPSIEFDKYHAHASHLRAIALEEIIIGQDLGTVKQLTIRVKYGTEVTIDESIRIIIGVVDSVARVKCRRLLTFVKNTGINKVRVSLDLKKNDALYSGALAGFVLSDQSGDYRTKFDITGWSNTTYATTTHDFDISSAPNGLYNLDFYYGGDYLNVKESYIKNVKAEAMA